MNKVIHVGTGTDVMLDACAELSKVEWVNKISEEEKLPYGGVKAVLALLSSGCSVPFIARYRKEQSGGMDETHIRLIEEKNAYYTELNLRRQSILSEITAQGKLTPELKAKIESCWVKSELEDLYLPYKPKRRTRAMMAKERGLEPLAQLILEQSSLSPEIEAQKYLSTSAATSSDREKEKDVEVVDTKAALSGARDIVAEYISEQVHVRQYVRSYYQNEGVLVCSRVGDVDVATKFEMYYDFQEKLATIASHRYLAISRGETENILRAKVVVDQVKLSDLLAKELKIKLSNLSGETFSHHCKLALDDALKRLLSPSIETDLRVEAKMKADREAIDIFAQNLKKLLLAPPLGRRAVLGIDPGQRTGCKVVVVDDTGKLMEHTLINLVMGEKSLLHAEATLTSLIEKYSPFAIAVGNGTHGRETFDFVEKIQKKMEGKQIVLVSVSESGASVYSASDGARAEFPQLDLTVRGAISIARRLQDPLAELVKVDPKAIGVGQYQHDVFEPLLKRKLDEVVESCVNSVGVEVNTASSELLARVAGIGPSLAKKIVKYREENGSFPNRESLKKISGLGPKTYEQCAGFMRVSGSENPLDSSAVHPERYGLVEKIARDQGLTLDQLVGKNDAVHAIKWETYRGEGEGKAGELTLSDIRLELLKPGRDPREKFEVFRFRDDVRSLTDLKADMVLEGVVTNVTAFGAFVDIGVHQDGLVHISELSDKFVNDPHQVVRVGDRLKVTVIEVDLVRKRIALSAKTRPRLSPGAVVADPSRSTSGASRASGPNHMKSRVSTRAGEQSVSGVKNKVQDQTFEHRPFAQLKLP